MTASSTYIPGDIDLQSCLLVNYNGKYIELREIILEFNVYHDIFSNGIKCDIIVDDAIGLIERVPIVGDETVIISFSEPTVAKYVTYVFSVYKVSDRVSQNDRSNTYVIHAQSQELINDLRSIVSRSYSNIAADEIVSDVYKTYLQPKTSKFSYIREGRGLSFESTEGRHTLIAPKVSPFQFIRMVSSEAQSKKYRSASFVFFETTKGWKFVTIENLMDKPAVDSFYFSHALFDRQHTIDNETIFPYQIIVAIDYASQFDNVIAHKAGMLDNDVEVIDPIRKKFSTESFLYDRDFEELVHLGKGKMYTEKSLYKKNDGSSRSTLLVSNIGESYPLLTYITNGRDLDPQIKDPRVIHKTLPFSLPVMASINNMVIDVTVPGNTELDVGDVVNLNIMQNSSDSEHLSKTNLFYGQKDSRFLVTAMRHTYNRGDNRFFTVLQCVKDTYAIEPKEIE